MNAITYQQAIKASLSKVTYTLIVIVVLYRYEFIFTRLAVVLKTIKSIGKYIEKNETLVYAGMECKCKHHRN